MTATDSLFVNEAERRVKYAAERFVAAHHPQLRGDDFYTQAERYELFFDAVALHLKQTANQYAKFAHDALMVAPSKPFYAPFPEVKETR